MPNLNFVTQFVLEIGGWFLEWGSDPRIGVRLGEGKSEAK